MHSNSAVMRGIVMNRIQNTDQTFEHERLWQRRTVHEPAVFSMHVYCTYGHIDRFAPLQHSSFDDGTSDASWLNRQNVLNPKPKPPSLQYIVVNDQLDSDGRLLERQVHGLQI